MEILRVFNNNVDLAKDSAGEKIVTGRGIGFKAHPGDVVDDARVARTFVPEDGRDPDHVATMLSSIPLAHVTLVTDAVAEAGLPDSLAHSASLLIALADHIGFAISRAASGQRLDYPLQAEVSQLYGEEYRQAKAIVAAVNRVVVQRELAPLPDAEAVAIALHLVNAGFSTGDLSFTYTMTGMLNQLLDHVESDYGIALDSGSVSIARFITHLRYLFVRIANHEQLSEHSSAIGRAIRDSSPGAYRSAQRLAALIELRLGAALTEDEVSYLTLHIARMVEAATPTRTATIAAPIGLHARPASLFAEVAAASGADVTVSFDGHQADAASVLEVMALGAKHGDVVTLSATGDGAADALDALAAMLERDLSSE
ncbi:HPr family phosphocarrier protein [Corynebacterium auris]|uniref:HPr family phosphocarrier protein n=1 Tax=Corynebacterium auris TaxID=44750 RepID=UPI0025B3FF99|nr:HPr family phosphocarrier protein [Corynebacterium auris]WJY68924.1 Transcription antiterminator LicT [Corynebacterium auris]